MIFHRLAFVLFSIALSVPCSWADWKDLTVIALSSGTGTNWLVLDSSGHPHTTNTSPNPVSVSSSDVNYVYFNGSAWNREPEFSTRTQRSEYRLYYLGLNSNDEPRLVYAQRDGAAMTP